MKDHRIQNRVETELRETKLKKKRNMMMLWEQTKAPFLFAEGILHLLLGDDEKWTFAFSLSTLYTI